MPDLDEFLRNELRRTIAPVDVNDVSSKIDLRRSRRERLRQVQAVGLTVIVLAGTVGGVAMLSRAFRGSGPGIGAVPDVRNGVIVYSEVRNAGPRLWVVNPDGSGARQLTTDRFASDTDPTVSPDGRTVAFVRTGADGSSICTIRIDGTGLTELSPADVSAVGPTWSPDGSRVAFAGEDGGIYVIGADGSGVRMIAGTEGRFASHLTWSPDGEQIAFAAGGDSARATDLWVTDIQGVTQVNLTVTPEISEGSPAWSPDGSRILFSRLTIAGASLMTIAPDPDAAPVAVTDGSTFDSNPAWSPDGTLIVFDRVSAASADVYVARPDGSEVTLMTRNATDPAWQPIPSDPTPSSAAPSPSPLPDGQFDIGLGFPVCNVQVLGGEAEGNGDPDFDGNGTIDTAYVATNVSDVGDCPQADTASNILGVDLTGDGKIDAEFGPVSCALACIPFVATDLNVDGDDELFVAQLVSPIVGLTPYQLVDEGGGPALVPITFVPPGDPRNDLPAGEPPMLYVGGDEGFASRLECSPTEAGAVLNAVTGHLDSIEQPTSWTVRQTIFQMDGDRFRVLDSIMSLEPVGDEGPFGSAVDPQLCGQPFPPNPAFPPGT
jgi:hypothetical protein